jgi:uncharacterized protein YodC (DUF2158 family)
MKSIGDIVRLKSGGCLMTVTSYDKKTRKVEVVWVSSADDSPQEELYPEDALQSIVLSNILVAVDGA